MPHLIDISLSIHPDMPRWGDDPAIVCRPLARATLEAKGSYNLTAIEMTTHVGTHVDPPRHFSPQGAAIDEIPLDVLCGEARVEDVRGIARLGARELEQLALGSAERLVLKTGHLPRTALGPPYLTQEGARYLRQHTHVKLVGIDSVSIEDPASTDYEVHCVLLCEMPPICILEGLDLTAARPGVYTLLCLPLKLRGGDGGPARAALAEL